MRAVWPSLTYALSSIVLASLIQWLCWPVLQPHAWLLYAPAIFFSACLGGLSSAALATALAALASNWLFLAPTGSLRIEDARAGWALLVFCTTSGLAGWAVHALQATGNRLAEPTSAEQQRAVQVQLRARRMETLGELASGIAHDFNNILLAIRGNARLALQDVPATSAARDSLQEIDKASMRASKLVQRILAFARQEEPQREYLHLPPVIEEAMRLLRPALPLRIKLNARFEPDLPGTLADATQIHQVVMNLATNAAHAIGERAGRIDISLSARHVDERSAAAINGLQPGDYLCLEVADDGCGMDRQTLEHSFEPLFTTKPPGQGTGLGLAVVDGILKSHGAALAADSEPGRGTTLHLYFPVAQAPAHAAQPPSALAPLPPGDQRILYVDDDEALVFLAGRHLKRLGYEVTACDDPLMALEVFRAHPDDYDAVVCDVSMPMLDGFELARHLLELRPQLPVIMTTGCLRETDQHQARQLGIACLMLKPATTEELGQALHRLLATRREALTAHAS